MKEKLRLIIPSDRQFSVREIAGQLYPHCIGYDSEGRLTNKAGATVARMLRKYRRELGIYELKPLEFHSRK